METLSPLFKALSEELRIRILLVLMDGEACVCELMDTFGMAQSKLSHHLIALRNAGFLSDEKRGKWNYYRIDESRLDPVRKEFLASLARWAGPLAESERDKRTLKRVKTRMNICC